MDKFFKAPGGTHVSEENDEESSMNIKSHVPWIEK